jgi:ABC-2 type transport system permease protein
MESVKVRTYGSESALMEAVASGAVDVGLMLEENFDEQVKKGEISQLTVYVWGESLLKNRALIGSALLYQIRSFSGTSLPVEIETVPLGNETAVTLRERMLPLGVLLAVYIAGFVIPATSLVEEKERRTAGAILITPVTLTELYLIKGFVGLVLSLCMGTSILAFNQGFGVQPGLTVMILTLGAVMSCCIGLIAGSFVDNIATMYTVVKMMGLFLYGPAIINLFPKIPQWIGRFFPTYYVMNPIMEITLRGGTWTEIRYEVCILIGVVAVIVLLTGVVANKTGERGM